MAAAGNVTYRSQQADDVTTQYMDVSARLSNLQAQRTRLQQLQAKAENLSDLLQIEDSLTECSPRSKAGRASWTGTATKCSSAPCIST